MSKLSIGMPRTSSSTVAIGAAIVFLVVAGLTSFLADEHVALNHVALGGGWTLRGALIPTAEAGAAAGRFAHVVAK